MPSVDDIERQPVVAELTSFKDTIVFHKRGRFGLEKVQNSEIHVKARSLDVYMKTYNPRYAIRISEKNFGFENNIKSVPLYAVFCI